MFVLSNLHPRRKPDSPGHFLVACAIVVLSIVSTTALAQRRPARGGRGANQASRDAGAADRGGYGTTGYGGTGAGRSGAAGADREGPLTYPARSTNTSGPTAEYQKPTYDHHRFAVSPDGTRAVLSGRHAEKLAATSADAPAKLKLDAKGKPIVLANVLEVIDTASGRSLVAFKPSSLFENLAISPDNQFLAAETLERPGEVNVLHLASRKSKQFKTPVRRIIPNGLVFSTDSRSINVVAPDRLLTIALASGETKELKFEFASPSASYTAAKNLVAVGVSRSRRGRPQVQVYDVATGKPIEELDVPSGPTCLQFSLDGNWLAATAVGGSVRVWQTSDWTAANSVAGQYTYDPGQLAVSSDGRYVAIRPRMLAGPAMRVIDVQSGEAAQSIASRDVFFMPAGTVAVAGVTGPFYMDVGSGNVTELPAEGAVAQIDPAASSFGDASQSQAGYGQTAPAGQVGYGQVTPPTGAQAGYGQVTSQPTSEQSGYGQVTPQRPSDQPGYGSFSPAESTPPANPAQPTPGADGRR